MTEKEKQEAVETRRYNVKDPIYFRRLKTVQTQQVLNLVYSIDKPGPGGAHHLYEICKNSENNQGNSFIQRIQFQKGPRNEEGSTSGVLMTDLLEIVKDLLTDFQAGPFSSEYNEQALTHVTAALCILNKRIEDRIERDVLGLNKK